ncbi:MAG TPA: hypothetical protein VM238_13450 [Phycisphaerae bacterium]|nr:hypothetical protein [Phycisphaerae bacterium]
MGISSSDIRAGRAYVELTAEDAKFVEGLRRAETRLKEWVERNRWSIGGRGEVTRGGKAAGVGGLTGDLEALGVAKGISAAKYIMAARLAMQNLEVISAAWAGDMKKAREEVEKLPYGIGTLAKMMAGPLDAAAQKWAFRIKGLSDEGVGAGLFAGGPGLSKEGHEARTAAVEAYNRGVKAVEALQQAYRKATMSARELAAAEVEAMNLEAGHAGKVLALRLKIIEADEARKRAIAITAKGAEGDRLITAELDEFAKATMSERDFLAYQVRQLGLSEEKADSLLRLREANLEVTEEQKRAQEALNALMAEAEADAAAWARSMQEAVDADQTRYDEAYDLTQAMRAPREKAGDEIAKYREMIEQGLIDPETYRRAVRATVEDLAAALPEAQRPTTGARGTFSGIEAYRLGSGGGIDDIAASNREIARNTDRLIKLTKELGVTYM